MNKTTLLLLLLITISSISFAQDCANPMSQTTFQSGFNLVASQPSNQKKLDKSLEFINKNCLLTSQIKNIAVLFSEDSYRLDFCRAAYLNTFDRVNFFDVYDAFTSFSAALRLYDYTQNPQQAMVPAKVTEQPKETVVPKFANIVYPSSAKYTGNKGCDGPITDDAGFIAFATQVVSQPTDEAKYIAITASAEDACYSLAQVMKVTSLITSEKLRYKTLNETFGKVYDQDHYVSARALFTVAELQNQWIASAQFMLTPPATAPAVVECTVAEADMKSVLKSIQSKNFPAEKLELLSVVKKDKCFNVAQVNTLSKEFPFDKDKLEAMKMLYASCPDKSNYYKLIDELSFAYLRDELTEFIKKDGAN